MKHITLDRWLGRFGPALDAEACRFKAVQVSASKDCKGCMFLGQDAATCKRASALAVAAGFPDCDDLAAPGKQFVYVAVKVDPRQISLIELA